MKVVLENGNDDVNDSSQPRDYNQNNTTSVSIQTEAELIEPQYVCQTPGAQGQASSKKKRYMRLNRGSKVLVHFYTKLTKRNRKVDSIAPEVEYFPWNTQKTDGACIDEVNAHNRDSTAQDYQEIDSDTDHGRTSAEHHEQNRNSTGEDYQVIDSDPDNDFEYCLARGKRDICYLRHSFHWFAMGYRGHFDSRGKPFRVN